MRVLVTGGAGYVGSVVIRRLLQAGYKVRAVDCLCWGGDSLLGVWTNPEFEFLAGDLTEPSTRRSALEGVEAVAHFAAIVGDPACKVAPERAEQVNLLATQALIDEGRSAGVHSFVFASTCSNYGISDPGTLAVEDSPLNPVSLYARTKVAAEEYLLSQSGPTFHGTVLRLATVYGVSARMRFDLTVNEFARDAALGRNLVIYGEQHWRPYVHVEDVARALQLVLESPPEARAGEVFNLGCSQENYQKLGIYRLLKARVPDLDVEFVETGPDPRSYKVGFDKIQTRLGFTVSKRVPDGLEEVMALARAGVINLDEARWRNT